MNDPAASGRGIREGFSFKSRSKLRGITPTGGIQYFLSWQLAGPYAIRAAHGQTQFLEAPFNMSYSL